jgi:hypothetical protein
MPLDNYANLQQQVVKWSHRDDIQEHAADCIALAESHMYRGTAGLRVPEMQTELQSMFSVKSIAFPAGLIEFRNVSVEIDGVFYRLKKIPLAQIPDDGEAGTPAAYALTSSIILDIEPDKQYNFKFEYYALPTPLSDATPVNDILTNYPNVYFYGAMAAAFQYAGEIEQVTYWGNLFQSAILKANEDADMLGYGTLPAQHIVGCIP